MVDLKKTLVSKVKINGHFQRVEYESLLNVCFTYGMYCHSADGCESLKASSFNDGEDNATRVRIRKIYKKMLKRKPLVSGC